MCYLVLLSLKEGTDFNFVVPFTQIGLMRSGKFLAEESPTNLMNMHGCDTLEDVFLKLSKEQNRCLRRRSTFMREVLGPEPAFEVAIHPISYYNNFSS